MKRTREEEETPKPKIQEPSTVVSLNVGGRVFKTMSNMLTQNVFGDENHFLKMLVSGDFPVDKDKDGNIFIDRSYKNFDVLLTFLRNDCDLDELYKNEKNIPKLIQECGYYGFRKLENILHSRKHIPLLKNRNKFVWRTEKTQKYCKFPELKIEKNEIKKVCQFLNEIATFQRTKKIKAINGEIADFLDYEDYVIENQMTIEKIIETKYTTTEKCSGTYDRAFLVTSSEVGKSNNLFEIYVVKRNILQRKKNIPNHISFGIIQINDSNFTSTRSKRQKYENSVYITHRNNCSPSAKMKKDKFRLMIGRAYTSLSNPITKASYKYGIRISEKNVMFEVDDQPFHVVDFIVKPKTGFRFFVSISGHVQVDILNLHKEIQNSEEIIVLDDKDEKLQYNSSNDDDCNETIEIENENSSDDEIFAKKDSSDDE
jgi:hypothetical protein